LGFQKGKKEEEDRTLGEKILSGWGKGACSKGRKTGERGKTERGWGEGGDKGETIRRR